MSSSTKHIMNSLVSKPSMANTPAHEDEREALVSHSNPGAEASMAEILTKCLTRKDSFDLTPQA